ncbi:MAG: radical SAM protein [Candidatus Omnitrophota bacterium]|nr:radical SAM protein [Candidatus Omnitrophota bacterium]
MDVKAANLLELEKEKKSGALTCKSRPIIMWLETTSRCNLKCIICPRTYLPFFKGKNLSADVFEVVKNNSFPYLKKVYLHCFGEPMLTNSFEYILEEAIKNNIDVSFATNGMFLTERLIRKFLEHDISFSISLDGAREETVKKIRRGVNFNRIIANIKMWNELKETEYKTSRASISLLCVALRSNIEELPELIVLANNLNIYDVHIRQFRLSIQSFSVWKESLGRHKKLANRYFLEAKNKAKQLGINLHVNFYDIKDSKTPKIFYKAKNPGHRFCQKCFTPWEKIIIRTNGDITPCCGSGEIMGNIKKDDFEKIWNGKKYQNFRRRINTNFPPLDCRNCVQATGITGGNPEDAKYSEPLSHSIIYFFEHKLKLTRYINSYLKDYL